MLNTLKPNAGAKKKNKRVGRGSGSQGKTSGKGHKGQKSRSGVSLSRWFEGGQTPLKLRVPKRGFKNIFKVNHDIINIKDLSVFKADDIVTPEELISRGIIKASKPVKLLGNGDLDIKLTIKVHSASKSAIAKVEENGGTVEII